jgi:hypothetical protein
MRVILILILVFLAIRFIMRLVLPLVVTSLVKKAQQNFQENMDAQFKRKPEGEVTIENVKRPGRPRDDGEFVEYEEIK